MGRISDLRNSISSRAIGISRSLDKKISLEPIFKTDRVIGSRIFFWEGNLESSVSFPFHFFSEHDDREESGLKSLYPRRRILIRGNLIFVKVKVLLVVALTPWTVVGVFIMGVIDTSALNWWSIINGSRSVDRLVHSWRVGRVEYFQRRGLLLILYRFHRSRR